MISKDKVAPMFIAGWFETNEHRRALVSNHPNVRLNGMLTVPVHKNHAFFLYPIY